MSLSLPGEPADARRLTDVVTQLQAALDGRPSWFAPVRSAIVFVVDGLGARNLSQRAAYARTLVAAGGRRAVARSVFPSTTATALTSLLTGKDAGEHGIVGYRVRVPGTDVVSNQLKGWETDGLDPRAWQRAEPIMERRSAAAARSFVVSRNRYRGTGFTLATMRGADFIGVDDLRERALTAAALADRHPGSLVYLYAPELDTIGHRHGWQSDQWAAGLEAVDAAVRALAGALRPGVGAVVTADHGMVDVPRHRQVLLRAGDPLLDGVRLLGGEPRMLHLYAEHGAAGAVLDAWRDAESARSWVIARDEAIEAGLFGRVAAEVRPRIGDVVVAARAGIAYYDDRVADKAPQRMIGQHGSLTDEERAIPLIRFGALAQL
ncbi:nucleotide pyrophosphatase [Microbacterium mangrovi]|uniref:Nucleotide pyrophosphatase n=1 Tax=Microbacterium mangrovi TaxID=1348253 RepID=A0A0B2A724_9MICO|nr:nucleotide pyrophosphatase/phosphodiesterase family protein [Microbacterium mangrovi]KHK97347.1 nucleotide pyrophosphatase [Microbacterium mangrovi]